MEILGDRAVVAHLSSEVVIIGADGAKIPKSFIENWELVKYDGTNKFNPTTGYFELNKEVDLIFEEAKEIYRQTRYWGDENIKSIYAKGLFNNPIRTFFFNLNGGDCTQMCDGNTRLKSYVVTNNTYPSTTDYMFRSCINLEEVIFHNPLGSNNSTFLYCPKLHTANIARLRKSISFSSSPLLTRESIRFMVDRADAGFSFTITVHQDAYDRLTQEDLDTATAKNITIVTP